MTAGHEEALFESRDFYRAADPGLLLENIESVRNAANKHLTYPFMPEEVKLALGAEYTVSQLRKGNIGFWDIPKELREEPGIAAYDRGPVMQEFSFQVSEAESGQEAVAEPETVAEAETAAGQEAMAGQETVRARGSGRNVYKVMERLFFLEDEGLVVCSGRRYAGDVLDQNAYEISISGKGRVFYFNVWDNDPDIAERLAEDIREKALAQTEPGIREMLMRAFEGLSGRMRNAPGEFPEKGKQEQEIDGRGFGQGQMASGEKSDNLKALSHEFFNDYELGF